MSTATATTTTAQEQMNADKSSQNIQDIQSLQKTEKDLLDNLDSNPNISPEKRQELIEKINAIAKMRLDLYKSLNQANQLYGKNLEQSQNIVLQQTAAIDVEERSLNDYKRKMKAMQEANLADLRIVENNHYFSEKYSEHTTLAWGLIQLFLGLIFINFLYKSAILPNSIYWALVIILTSYIAYNFWGTLLLAYKRNNMNYDQLDFAPPNPDSIPASYVTGNDAGSSSDPWYMPSAACVGANCCTSNMVFDASSNMCVVSASSSTENPKEGFHGRGLAYAPFPSGLK